jgi:hypothetical protein
MQPNDLPLVCLPMDLSDEAAASVIEFLYALTDALERQYAGQLLRYAHRHEPESSPPDSQITDPPF